MSYCKHINIEDFQVLADKGLIIYFDDGSHTYLDPDEALHLANCILFRELYEDG